MPINKEKSQKNQNKIEDNINKEELKKEEEEKKIIYYLHSLRMIKQKN
jgi:hypothetical protein